MSVLIKGIELPKKVQVLELHSDGKVFTRKGYLVGEAVELPGKHGRLIDADAIVNAMNDMKVEGEVFGTAVNYVKLIMNDADTIVEAEDET